MRGLLAAGAALATALTLAGCSGTSHAESDTAGSAPSAAGSGSSAPSPLGTVATRWWSNGAATDGSTIDPENPDVAADELHPDRAQYCTMLSQTVKAGKSILPGATATDPRLLASTQAFVGELQHVAPAAVAKQWKLLGDALIEFVKTGGKSLGGASSTEMSAAARTIATDAKHACNVDIS